MSQQGKILITGSGGLVGSEAVLYFSNLGYDVYGIDNDMRSTFFGTQASVKSRIKELDRKVSNYYHSTGSICDEEYVQEFIKLKSPDVIIHTAAQPSHDFAASDPKLDFRINTIGTMNLLEATRKYVPDCVFIYTSTNKVYGARPNTLLLEEKDYRYDPPKSSPYYYGITETMSIDHTIHSIFGASKTAADLMVQEYGQYFKIKTVCFRCGCITGPAHRGAELHGFLSYLMRCIKYGIPYTIYGYKGKQVRDNIHAHDLVTAFDTVIKSPVYGTVFNLGGGRQNSCSILEAIHIGERMLGKKLNYTVSDKTRIGDHKWWITSNSKFGEFFPDWKQEYTLEKTIEEICCAV